MRQSETEIPREKNRKSETKTQIKRHIDTEREIER